MLSKKACRGCVKRLYNFFLCLGLSIYLDSMNPQDVVALLGSEALHLVCVIGRKALYLLAFGGLFECLVDGLGFVVVAVCLRKGY